MRAPGISSAATTSAEHVGHSGRTIIGLFASVYSKTSRRLDRDRCRWCTSILFVPMCNWAKLLTFTLVDDQLKKGSHASPWATCLARARNDRATT